MLFCSEKLPRLRFYNGGNLTSAGGFIHQRRTMECFVLIYVLSGCLNLSVGGREHTVQGGEWILMKPGAEHSGTAPSESELSYLWAHFSTEEPLTEAGEPPENFSLILQEHGTAASQRVSLLFRQLVDCSRREMYTPRMAECALEMLLTEMTQEYLDRLRGHSPLPPLIADINEWILVNCHRQLSVKMIAEEFHYNPEYLSALYKKETGQTLTSSVNKARIDISKKLLSDSSVSIKEAAFSCGFTDEKYYMRIFRRTEGMTPMQYRAALGVR